MKEKLLFWKTSSWSLSLLLVLPILAILYTALGNTDDIFTHLFNTVLPTYTLNTVLLVFGAMFFSLILGVPSAWFMAMCRIPSSSILQWALVLPLAMPAYIVGYIYTDWLDFAGPIQVLLRDIFGWQSYSDYWFPDIRTLTGAILVMSLVLYPYVYLLARAAFMEQNISLLQSARLLKCTPWESFKRISLPLARPSIAVALSLVAMEALGDFGTVSYFAVNTLTTAVYDTWLGYSNLNAAAKVSAFMLMGILLLISGERYSRRKQKMFQEKFNTSEEFQYQLHGWKKWSAFIWCWGLVSIAFIFPLMQLISYAIDYFEQSWTAEFQEYAINSLYVSSISAVIAVIIAVVVNFLRRLKPASKWSVIPMRLASLGYAVPGTVLAIGVMLPMIGLDHFINDVSKQLGFGVIGLIFSGSIFALIFASVTRFSAVAIGSIESNLNKIPPSLDMASRTLGCGTWSMLRRVHFPLIRRGCLIAGLLVFIETMKELNAALLLRPFNFETLATYVFNFASDEQLEIAAMPAVLLVLVGLIPLIIVNRSLEQHH
ncbi:MULTISPECIES: ABC transporter permease [Aliivibrio]|uniref:ABC transporter permease n=1 Tax=Aliivibrio TaxID=511678 RepID=UPI00080E4653|nr:MULTISPECIES: iron ABC transporter permease [Aliivibrio]MBD1571316.1 iron ABC transporter permease [Aliivibrio sp. S10_S31]MUK28199.1 ABC transporter permease subunit [Aliivibrio fischeri]MUK35770.1 ABC transporter permease subunit [Aliivibrio fischeri]OCH01525.1 iron ABC transporter permease [Aliivibrio fischeri]OCH31870.1 iron ABC transporter permease [Aliivibrio fischeri]